jgi:hypothetical protein
MLKPSMSPWRRDSTKPASGKPGAVHPQSLSVRLPVVDGHDWIRIGTELVLVGIATNLVAQVIHKVFT